MLETAEADAGKEKRKFDSATDSFTVEKEQGDYYADRTSDQNIQKKESYDAGGNGGAARGERPGCQ